MIAIEKIIKSHASKFHKIIDFNIGVDNLVSLDFTANNIKLTEAILNDTDLFSTWIDDELVNSGARYGIGGYNEHRTIYARSTHFDSFEEPRRLHLGVDIWAPFGTPIYNFYDATVHSFGYHNNFGDYGATIILTYEIESIKFNVLYGHLSLASLIGLKEGKFLPAGTEIATLGAKEENGNWPPHLHFQIIKNMQGFKGDYPGVCKFSERDKFLVNCPDPIIILNSNFY